MKKFITYVSMQPGNMLEKVNYQPVDNDELKKESEVFFPVSVLVDSYADPNESFSIICIMENENEDVRKNYETLKTEINEICKDRNNAVEFISVITDKQEKAASHLKTFKALTDAISDGDDIYVCCTYGTKPVPILEMMALNYAYRVKKNVSIKSVVYGKLNRKNGSMIDAYIYDVTSLFFMNQIVNDLAEQKVKNPDRIIKKILDISDDEPDSEA